MKWPAMNREILGGLSNFGVTTEESEESPSVPQPASEAPLPDIMDQPWPDIPPNSALAEHIRHHGQSTASLGRLGSAHLDCQEDH